MLFYMNFFQLNGSILLYLAIGENCNKSNELLESISINSTDQHKNVSEEENDGDILSVITDPDKGN